ncbi:DUF3347 domain-containing protein [Rapidithrix thailandica]|uniref:DUF3347 domain-containing protein n=1 Tax=Rapidithrix thailandica TaxID=413964 RepID=A0AAW9RXQ6_9BACT
MKFKSIIASIALVFSTTVVVAQQAGFSEKALGTAVQQYLILENKLVASDAGEAQKAAQQLQTALKKVKNNQTILQYAEKIASSTQLDKQRVAFSSLSNALIALVEKSEFTSGALYKAYCPMANGNQGAYWLSSKNEVLNPYFGNKMLKCGAVKATLK